MANNTPRISCEYPGSNPGRKRKGWEISAIWDRDCPYYSDNGVEVYRQVGECETGHQIIREFKR